MKIKSAITIAVATLLTVSFVLLGIYSVRRYSELDEQRQRTTLLKVRLEKADAIQDNGAAVAAFKKLSPALPEIQLRILERQWQIALELMGYMQRAQYNRELQDETAAYAGRLKSHLDEMLDRAGSTLADAGSLRPEIAWQLYNLAGSARALNALIMLESGESVDRVQGVMRDALTDFKAAIEAVDRAVVPPLHRNIPRWNFELLNGEEYVQKFDVAMTDSEKNQVLKENLETLIPELGGYAPGEPIETMIRK